MLLNENLSVLYSGTGTTMRFREELKSSWADLSKCELSKVLVAKTSG